MGANAQTSVPLFVANSVLTAAQQNISAATGVPVFATTVTRDAAFGGSNKVLAEGQLCYLESTDVVQQYNGSSWITVGPATASGLVCVKAETTFTTAAAVNVDNVFTSTYTNYLVHFSLAISLTNDTGYYIRLRASSTDTSTGYYYGMSGSTQAGAAVNAGSDNAAQFNLGDIGNVFHLSQLTFGSPQVAARTSLYASSQESATNTTTNRGIQTFGGFLNNATQYDGFSVFPSAGTITGSYIVYGYSKAV